jgi:hypothetical protein
MNNIQRAIVIAADNADVRIVNDRIIGILTLEQIKDELERFENMRRKYIKRTRH